MPINVFLSVGRPFREEQENFLSSLEKRLGESGLRPSTVGRNTFSHLQPLRHVETVMSRCAGTLILAWERLAIERGQERCGAKDQRPLENVALTTPWNQIEAALAYSRRLPLLVIKDKRVREEGLLEKGFDWYVYSANLGGDLLESREFNGLYRSWIADVKKRAGWFGCRA